MPPPAWMQSSSGGHWMAYGSYCWDGTCADMAPPEMRKDIPALDVTEGQRLTFHLGFDPTELRLSFLSDSSRDETVLPSDRVVRWTVTRGGFLQLTGDAGSPGGDASYVIELVLEPT